MPGIMQMGTLSLIISFQIGAQMWCKVKEEKEAHT